MLSECHCVSHHLFEEHLSEGTSFLVYQSRYVIYPSALGEMPNSSLGYPLDAVAKHCTVMFSAPHPNFLASSAPTTCGALPRLFISALCSSPVFALCASAVGSLSLLELFSWVLVSLITLVRCTITFFSMLWCLFVFRSTRLLYVQRCVDVFASHNFESCCISYLSFTPHRWIFNICHALWSGPTLLFHSTPRKCRIQSQDCNSSTRSNTWSPIHAHMPQETASSITLQSSIPSIVCVDESSTNHIRTYQWNLTSHKKKISCSWDIASHGPSSSWVTIMGHN